MLRRRGNPNWGKSLARIPYVPTAFEVEARKLGLTKETFEASSPLRLWCERNCNRYYVPEWLLEAWGILVDSDLSGAA